MHLLTEVLRYAALVVVVVLLIGLLEGFIWFGIVALFRSMRARRDWTYVPKRERRAK